MVAEVLGKELLELPEVQAEVVLVLLALLVLAVLVR